MEKYLNGQMAFNSNGEVKEKPKKKLSDEAKKLVKKETQIAVQNLLQKNIEDYKNTLMKSVSEYIYKKNLQQRKLKEQEKLEMAENVLKQYFPLKQELKNIEETYLSDENLKESEDKYIQKIMKNQFEEIKFDVSEKMEKYIEIKQLFNFLDITINNYIKNLNIQNESLRKYLEKNKDVIRLNQLIEKNERKIFILEEHYKNGVSAKDIKENYYTNDKQYSIDRRELLKEIGPYFMGMYDLLDIY